jgi:hypothetical protein
MLGFIKIGLRKVRWQLACTLYRSVVIGVECLDSALLVIKLFSLFVNESIVLKLNLLIHNFSIARSYTVGYRRNISGGIPLLTQVILVNENLTLGIILHPLIPFILYHLLIVLHIGIIGRAIKRFSIVLENGDRSD